VVGSISGVAPVRSAGSLFGINHGFTHLGEMPTVLPSAEAEAELDGLKASAVAVALTVFNPLLQIRAKK